MPNTLVAAGGGALSAGLQTFRRQFLRGLVGVPLAEVAASLFGQPAAAAASAPLPPPSVDLLQNYDTWLCLERAWLRFEREAPSVVEFLEPLFRDRRTGEISSLTPALRYEENAAGSFSYDAPLPSTRAATVLSTVGINWRADER